MMDGRRQDAMANANRGHVLLKYFLAPRCFRGAAAPIRILARLVR